MTLIGAHGGDLKNLLVAPDRAAFFKREAQSMYLLTLNQRQLCDLELLMTGAYSPLDGFMDEEIYTEVLENTRLPNGLLWSLPVSLDVSTEALQNIQIGQNVGLCDQEGFMLAVLEVTSIWRADKRAEAQAIYGTTSDVHPGVYELYHSANVYVGGKIYGIEVPHHYDFEVFRQTPAELRAFFSGQGWHRVVGFHTTKPMHRLHYQITLDAAQSADAKILIHPAVGIAKPGDLHYYSRVRCYRALMQYYPPQLAKLSLASLAVRMAGPREALHNAIVRQNYGCTHFVVGPEHAAPPGVREGAVRFYPKYAAQEFVASYQGELSIRMVATQELCYSDQAGRFIPRKKVEPADTPQSFSEKRLHAWLEANDPVPECFSFPGVLEELKKIIRPRYQCGLTLFFTGLSGAGKSTLAKILYAKLVEHDVRPVTLLDGDIVRKHLSSELGFSKKDRDINVRRIGFVASEITKNGGIAICAPIAPYTETRRAVREMVEQYGAFIEIHVATPLDVCESRDRKGLYAKARKSLIAGFTGISDPYEVPENPEVHIDTSQECPEDASEKIMIYLVEHGYRRKATLHHQY